MNRVSSVTAVLAVFLSWSTMAYSADPWVLDLVTNDLVQSRYTGMLYASVPGRGGSNYDNTVVEINPTTGMITQAIPVASKPSLLAISDDGSTLYVSLDDVSSVQKINLKTMAPETLIQLGTDEYDGPFTADDIAVDPFNTDIIAVSLKAGDHSPRHKGVAIFNNGQKLTNTTQGSIGSNRIEYTESSQQLIGYNNESVEFGLRSLYVELNVDPYNDLSGVTEEIVWEGYLSGFDVDFVSFRDVLYSTTGKALLIGKDPVMVGSYWEPIILGQFPITANASSIFIDDIEQKAYFLAGNQIEFFDLNMYTPLGKITVPTYPLDTTDDLVMYEPGRFALRAANGTQVMFFDALSGDVDGDGIDDYMDNCPWLFNPMQEDYDLDNIGDYCDLYPDDADHYRTCLIESQLQWDFIESLINDNQQLQSDMASCQNQIQDLSSSVDLLRTANSQLVVENEQLKNELTALKNSIDTDKDGVPDYLDLCPNTKRNRTVNENGCN